MGFIDALVSLVVIAVFGWFILMSLSKKNPKIEEWIKNIKPLYEQPEKVPMTEEMKQTWNERRSTI